MDEHPRQVLRREPRSPGRGRRDDDAIEGLDVPQAAERVDRRATALDARVDRNPCAARRELHRLEDRHRPAELRVLNGRVEAVLERHDHEVRGHEHRVLSACDAECGLEHHRIELAVA